MSANLNLFAQEGPDAYEPVETLGTRAGMRTMAMDHAARKIYGVTADAGKKILTAVSPSHVNTSFADSFTVLTFGR